MAEGSWEGTWWCRIEKVKFQIGIKQIIKGIKVIIKGKINQKQQDQAVIEKLKAAEMLEEQKFMEKQKAGKYETETLRIQQQVAKAKALVKILEKLN